MVRMAHKYKNRIELSMGHKDAPIVIVIESDMLPPTEMLIDFFKQMNNMGFKR